MMLSRPPAGDKPDPPRPAGKLISEFCLESRQERLLSRTGNRTVGDTRNESRAANTWGKKMTNATLEGFRMIAEAMNAGKPTDWQWIGQHMSQRMFGITEERAKEYAARHGGEAKRMEQK